MTFSRTTLALAATMLGTAAQAAVISNPAGTTSHDVIGIFGQSSTTTYGQTFTVGSASVLENWSFYGANSSSGPTQAGLNFGVASWDSANARAVNNLYSTAGTLPTPGPAFAPLSFNGINLNLAAGTYMAYVTVFNVPANAVDSASFNGSTGNGGLGGAFYFDTGNGGTDPTRAGAVWSTYQLGDSPDNYLANMQFTATINPAAVVAVPEPQTSTLLLAALTAMGLVSRRRNARAPTA